jgi:peptidoglycan/LPS O-acetylase OafA/YrhL
MTTSPPSRQNNFNLLRLAFATLVMLSHAPELIDGNRSREILTRTFHTLSFGEFAVDGFFLLSGYLIVQSWTNAPRLFDFMRSRVLRIFPAFIVATLVCAYVVGPLAADPSIYFAHFWKTALVKGMLWLQPPVIPPVFAGTHYAAVNGSMWTIWPEFKCYLGVLIAGVSGMARRRNAWFAATLTLLAVFTLHRFGILGSPGNEDILSDPLLRFASFFMIGACFYLFREWVNFDRRLAVLASIALLLGMFSLRLSELALLTAGAYLLFYIAFKPIALIENFNALPDVSYGVYLYGWPVQKLLLWYFPMMSPWVLFVLSCLAAVLCGVVSWYVVEKPFLRFKSRNRIKSPSVQLNGHQGEGA